MELTSPVPVLMDVEGSGSLINRTKLQQYLLLSARVKFTCRINSQEQGY